MKLIKGHLDYAGDWERPDIYLFTGNSTVKKNGAIVMGRGAAKQVRDTYPGIDKVFGGILLQERADGPYDPPIMLTNNGPKFIGCFNVKSHWANDADLDRIALSTTELIKWAEEFPSNIWHMNFPGIGNGGLDPEAVMPVVKRLPDSVLLYV